MSTKKVRKGSRGYMAAMKRHRFMMSQMAEKRHQKSREEMDRIKRNAGYRFRLDAWIHPIDDGDDFLIRHYFREIPHPKNVQLMLTQKVSALLNDYALIDITDGSQSILAAQHLAAASRQAAATT